MPGCQWELEPVSPAWGVCLHGSLSLPHSDMLVSFDQVSTLWGHGSRAHQPSILLSGPLLWSPEAVEKKVSNFVTISRFLLPSPRSASSAALNGLGLSGATNRTVIILNSSPIWLCWAAGMWVTLLSLNNKDTTKTPSLLDLLSVWETLWDLLVCEHIKNNVMLHLLQPEKNKMTLQRGSKIRSHANNGRTSSTWAALNRLSTRLSSDRGRDTVTSYLLINLSWNVNYKQLIHTWLNAYCGAGV